MYQAPLLYNWKLDELSCVTRVTAILRSALMMGALIPFNINTMSIYSFSGKLLKEGDFIHPGMMYSDNILISNSHCLPKITFNFILKHCMDCEAVIEPLQYTSTK